MSGRASSTTPVPRVDSCPSEGNSTNSVVPSGCTSVGPLNPFGSGSTAAPSVPVNSSSIRRSAESKLSTSCADPPRSKSTSAVTVVGTVTANSVPARGPEPMTRVSRARPPAPVTRRTGPMKCTSAVR
jgi:hypothetical protein